ncbi:hypothetical protein IKE79_00585, partial [Candidatus Saccharibacteria bacterium]|nr:hypothetical protein [Candidatus Saccharibacteria bacterium]
MLQAIHTKPKIKPNKINRIVPFPAIMCALITLLTPVISVATNYSSVFADSISTQEDFNFSVTVHELPT